MNSNRISVVCLRLAMDASCDCTCSVSAFKASMHLQLEAFSFCVKNVTLYTE